MKTSDEEIRHIISLCLEKDIYRIKDAIRNTCIFSKPLRCYPELIKHIDEIDPSLREKYSHILLGSDLEIFDEK